MFFNVNLRFVHVYCNTPTCMCIVGCYHNKFQIPRISPASMSGSAGSEFEYDRLFALTKVIQYRACKSLKVQCHISRPTLSRTKQH